MEFVKKEKREAREARYCVPACCSGQKTHGKKNKAYAADSNSGDNSSSSTSIASDNNSFDEEVQISRVDAKAIEYKPPADPKQDLPADALTAPTNQLEEANENGGAEYYNEEGNKLQGETIVVDMPMADRDNGDGSINNQGTAEQESVGSTAQNNTKNNEHVPLPSSRPASTEPVLPAPLTQHPAQSALPVQAPSPYFLQKHKRSDSTPEFDHRGGFSPSIRKDWWKAIEAELYGLDGNQMFCEEIPPDGANYVSMKWVFTIKKNLDGIIKRFKARLVT
ncbi:MAG: hypothetical protein FRX48_01578 [Lasallia pustulata]|uniref:Reverse transcriptase, RNA-dependent DNA polymerase n=1 Tax=Lasallia pustulata TaxID=136370 RepID=A0A5M8Q0X1_9LECA|nr:MAG: hypothetical protein FRX48_01578 [Lasallia pustulata]